MKNPHTKLPGYVGASYDMMNGWVVVLDRSKIEPYSKDRIDNRWMAKHMESGKTKAYRTQDEAKFEAYRCANSVHGHDHWWAESK